MTERSGEKHGGEPYAPQAHRRARDGRIDRREIARAIMITLFVLFLSFSLSCQLSVVSEQLSVVSPLIPDP